MKHATHREGYLLVDHRGSPGFTAETIAQWRRLGHDVSGLEAGSVQMEFKTRRCGHCGTPVKLTIARDKVRGHCFECDKFVCAGCKVRGGCRPIEALADALIGSDKKLSPVSPLVFRSH